MGQGGTGHHRGKPERGTHGRRGGEWWWWVMGGRWCFFPLTREMASGCLQSWGQLKLIFQWLRGGCIWSVLRLLFCSPNSPSLRASHLLLRLQLASMLRLPRSLLCSPDSCTNPKASHLHEDIPQALQTQSVPTEPFAIPTKYTPHLGSLISVNVGGGVHIH